ncbi:MAG: lactate racemase domain-containing protein [Pirellulaceae bacterium]
MTNLEPQRFFQQHPLAIQSAPGGELLTLAPLDLQALSDPRQAMRQALLSPEDFPALNQAIVQGDSIAIAVDPNLPDLIACVIGALDAIGSETAGSIHVLLGEDGTTAMLERLTEAIGDRATVLTHDPDNQEALGYLAASEAADPIYLNRLLLEADFVLPLACCAIVGLFGPDR